MLNYAIIFNAASNGMAITESDSGNIVDVNTAWIRATGIARETAIGKRAADLGLWVNQSDREACMAEFAQNARLVDFEVRLLMQSVQVPYLISAQIVQLGNANHVLWEFRDISRQRNDEAALRASEQKLVGILDNVDAYIYLKDIEGHYLFANRPVRALWNAQMEDIVGFGDEKFFDAATSKNIQKNDRLVLDQGLTVRDEETNTIPVTGKTFTYLSTKLPLRREDGSIYALCGISTDITERQHAEVALRANEHRLRTIIDTEPECIKVVNDLGQLVEMNSAGLALLEAGTLEEAQSQPLLEYILPTYRDAFMTLHTRVMQGDSGVLAFEITGLKGTRRWLETHAAPLRDGAGRLTSLLAVTRDITERVRDEEALRKSASRLQMAIENSRMMIWELDLACDEFRYDEAALSLLDIETDTPPHTLQSWLALVHPDDRAVFAAKFHASGASGEPLFDFEYRCATQPEQWGWVRTRGEFIQYDTQGSPLLAVGSTMNINENKMAELELQLTKDRFELIFNHNPDVMVISRLPDGVVTNVNDAFCTRTGYRKEEVIGHTTLALALWSSEDRQKMMESLGNTGECIGLECQFTLKDGSKRYGSFSAIVTQLKGVPHLVSTVHDITDRKQTEDQLRKLAQTVEQSPESIVITNMAAEIEYVNETFIRNSGYSREELIGRNPRMLHSGKTPKAIYDSFWNAMTEGHLWKGEFYNKRKDGSEFVEFAIVTPIRKADGSVSHYVAIKEDITEKKRLSEELDQHRHHLEKLVEVRTNDLAVARDAAEAANIAKSVFLANMSHEIRTPLNAVLGMAKIGLRDNLQSSAGGQFRHILNSGQHLLGVINDILDFSKIEAGKLEVETRRFQLAVMAEEVVNLMREPAREKSLPLNTSIATDLPDWIEGDSLRLRQILVNLLSNAIKFTRQGEVKLSIHKQDQYTLFQVADSGIGISDVQMEMLFQPFQQADSSTTRRYGGTGLGLVISRRLAELMGGDISVESSLGKGSVFTLRLPLKMAEPVFATISSALVGVRRLSELRILAAEDLEINRIILEDLLLHEGAKVVFAEDGQQVLDHLEADGEDAFDVVLMDIQMPVMDGHEATRRLLEVAPSLPVIGLTAHALEEERDKCLASGMVDHVTKPIDVDVLVATIHKYVLRKPDVIHMTASDTIVQPVVDRNNDRLIDWAALNARFSGREEFIHKLAQAVLDTHSDAPEKLRVLACNNDFAAIAFLAHNIKGMTGNLAANSLHELSSTTEKKAHNQDVETIIYANKLAGQIAVLLDELAAYIQAKQ